MRRTVTSFWEHCFARTFAEAQLRYASVARGLAEYCRATSLAELVATSLLRIRLNGDVLEAIDGAYRVRLRDVARIVVLPSAFNERRYWSSVPGTNGAIMYLPWFDPSIELSTKRDNGPVFPVLRALADPSRWKLVRVLLEGPRPAVELVAILGLNKATVSHHVRVLVDAKLVARTPERGRVLLSANREELLQLGSRIVDRSASTR